jgi:transcriptional regulator with GAF, ATPase, and Fis domain
MRRVVTFKLGIGVSVNRVSSSTATALRRPPPAAHRRAGLAARGAFPRLADFYFVHVTTPRTLRCVAAGHRTRSFARDMRSMVGTCPIRRDDLTSTAAFVVRSGKPALRSGIHRDNDRMRGNASVALQRRLAPTSALVVPVMADHQVLGALSLCYSHSGRSHGPQHVPLAQRLAARIAAALIAASHAASRLRSAARHARQRTALRRRMGARD